MRSGYRSFFWPGVLVLIGIVALLVNLGVIPADRLYELIDLWPLVLIVIGAEIIVRRTLAGTVATVVALAVVLVAVLGAAAYVAYSPNPGETRTLDRSASLGDLKAASLEVDVGSATLRISSDTTLGGDLYRAHIQYSGREPAVDLTGGGRLKISQRDSGFPSLRPGRFTMDLALNSSIPWSIVENSGAVSDTLNLADLNLQSLEINTGASRDDITLGTPSGAVPVRVNGGALTVHITRAGGVDASIHVSGGAVTLTADGNTYHAVGSASYSTPSQGTNRYAIEVNGGACTVTLDSTKTGPPTQP